MKFWNGLGATVSLVLAGYLIGTGSPWVGGTYIVITLIAAAASQGVERKHLIRS